MGALATLFTLIGFWLACGLIAFVLQLKRIDKVRFKKTLFTILLGYFSFVWESEGIYDGCYPT
jgi:hypothetical protein